MNNTNSALGTGNRGHQGAGGVGTISHPCTAHWLTFAHRQCAYWTLTALAVRIAKCVYASHKVCDLRSMLPSWHSTMSLWYIDTFTSCEHSMVCQCLYGIIHHFGIVEVWIMSQAAAASLRKWGAWISQCRRLRYTQCSLNFVCHGDLITTHPTFLTLHLLGASAEKLSRFKYISTVVLCTFHFFFLVVNTHTHTLWPAHQTLMN